MTTFTNTTREYLSKLFQPKQTMREFFRRDDVRALQEMQKRNHPSSDAHVQATEQIRLLAVAVGAGEYFE